MCCFGVSPWSPRSTTLQHNFTKEELKTVNIEKIIVVPDGQLDSSTDLRDSDEIPRDIETVPTSNPPTRASAAIDPDMAKLTFALEKYLVGLPKIIIFCYFIINSTRNRFTD